jgi:sugar phosphate isomerase/epimerase
VPLERFGVVQFADAPEPLSPDTHHESMHRRVPPGDGILPLRRFCDSISAKGYDGVVSTEVLSQQWRHGDLHEFTRASLDSSRALWNASIAKT